MDVMERLVKQCTDAIVARKELEAKVAELEGQLTEARGIIVARGVKLSRIAEERDTLSRELIAFRGEVHSREVVRVARAHAQQLAERLAEVTEDRERADAACQEAIRKRDEMELELAAVKIERAELAEGVRKLDEELRYAREQLRRAEVGLHQRPAGAYHWLTGLPVVISNYLAPGTVLVIGERCTTCQRDPERINPLDCPACMTRVSAIRAGG